MISEDNIIQKSTDTLESVVDKELVVLGIESGKYIGINEVGAEIWQRLDEPILVSALVTNLTELYNEDIVVIGEQVKVFLSKLYELSLIRIINED